MSSKILEEVTHRGVTAELVKENGKYMVYLWQNGRIKMLYQVRGLKEPLTKNDLCKHIDVALEESAKRKAAKEAEKQNDEEIER